MTQQKYNKVKGSKFEIDLENYLNESAMKARRLPRAGKHDIGDVDMRVSDGVTLVFEAKNVKVEAMAEWLREADVEACNHELRFGVPTVGAVVRKARGKGIGEARVTMTLDSLINLLRWNGLG
jgi:hypothetical protein